MTPKSSELCQLLLHGAAVSMRERRRTGFLHKSYEAFVLAHGMEYVSAPLDPRERAHVERLLREHREFWRSGFAYNRCFINAQRLMPFDTTGTLVYVEGFVWGYADRLPPVHHGWLSLHGKVIDLTAPTRATTRILPPEPPQLHGEFEGRAYFGVPFLRRYVRERTQANLCWGSLLEDEENDYRMLARGGDGAVRSRP